MIQVRTLGTFRLRWMEEPDAGELELTRPKLLALLAILLLSRPERYQRRDVLAGLLWGGLPDARARGALSQALYSLRSALGEEVIVTRGHEEVGLNPARISCDLADFERLVQEERLEEALDLYRGELLSGFFLPRHRAFHEWLEGRRREVRDLAVGAARQGLQLAREKDDEPGALAWVRRLTALRPFDEEAHRDLLLLLSGSGDRTGAIEAYQEFVSRLRSELEVEPSAETLALAKAIRSPHPGESPEAPTGGGPSAGSRVRTSFTEPTPDGVARPSFHGLPALRWVALPTLGLLAAGLLWAAHRGTAPEPRTLVAEETPLTLLILPFAVHGPEDHWFMREGVPDLLAAKLLAVLDLHPVDPLVVSSLLQARELLEVEASRAFLPNEALELAREAGAEAYVTGSAVVQGGRIRLTGTLRLVDSGTVETARSSVVGGPQELFEAVDHLTLSLVQELGGPPGRQMARLAHLTTDSYEALRHYLEGERRFRETDRTDLVHRFSDAQDSYRRAVTADPGFTLAWYRLAAVGRWRKDPELIQTAAQEVLDHAHRLPERFSVLVQGSLAELRGDGDLAEEAYRFVLERHPNDPEALLGLGRTLLLLNPVRGRPIEEAREYLERYVALGSPFEPVAGYLALLDGMKGDYERMVGWIEEVYGYVPFHWRATYLLGTGVPPSDPRLSGPGPGESHSVWPALPGWILPTTGHGPWTRSTLARGVQEVPRELLGPTLHAMAVTEAATGRPRAAAEALGQLRSIDPTTALLVRAELAALPLLVHESGETRSIRDSLRARRGSFAAPHTLVVGPPNQGVEDVVARYLEGRLSLRLEEKESAWASVALLRSAARGAEPELAETETERDLAWDLALALEAELRRDEGELHRALVLLRGLNLRLPGPRTPSPHFQRVWARLLKAEVLEALGILEEDPGRLEEALAWYRSLLVIDQGPWVSVLGPMRLGQARILERLGDPEGAAEEYRIFLRAWEEAEEELQGVVVQAQEALSRLEAPALEPPV